MNALKIAMEKSDFQGRDDTPKLIEALEGLEMPEGDDFPQGDKTLRKEDHQAFLREFIFEIKDGQHRIVEVVPKEKTWSRRPVSSSDQLRGLRSSWPRPVGDRGRGDVSPVLRAEGLTVRFGGLVALNGVSFEVQRDEIRAIIGPNGAGKSTLFNCLTGVLRPTSGWIRFNGEDITGLPPDRISRKGIARSYQITNILPNATTLENVRIAAQSRRHRWSLLTHHRAYHDIIERAEAVLQAVGLHGHADELAANLSHGEQRHLEIGIALATEPELLCLDEPTAGMSAAETHDTMALIRRIAQNLTILIVEHDMQVVMELAQRITVLHYGEILAEGTPAEIRAEPPGAGGLSQDMSLREPPGGPSRQGRGHPHLLRQEPCPARGLARGRGRRSGRPARAQRRRQEHDAQDHHGPRPSEPRQGAVRGPADDAACRHIAWRGSGSATCPRTAGSSRS